MWDYDVKTSVMSKERHYDHCQGELMLQQWSKWPSHGCAWFIDLLRGDGGGPVPVPHPQPEPANATSFNLYLQNLLFLLDFAELN